MNEHFVQMGPMWALAGLSAGWLADNVMSRRGYGLIVDMGLGVGAGVVGASIFLAWFSIGPMRPAPARAGRPFASRSRASSLSVKRL
jgi:hypothetical protein